MIPSCGVIFMTNDVGRRIAELRRERGLNQEQLAELALLSRVTVARYESGRIEPGANALSRIADVLDVSVDELLCRTEKLPPFISIMKSGVPIVGEIACGTPITAQQNVTGYADLPESVNADFALKCKGKSMSPTFEEGDLVLIRQTPDIENGQIAAVGIDGEAMLKRVYKSETGVTCVSDNPAFAPVFFPAGEGLTVYGMAVGYVRNWR